MPISVVLAAALAAALKLQKPPSNSDEAKVAPYALENPLDYTREQILGVFAKEMYGQEPPPPEALLVEKVEEGETLGGLGLRRQYRMCFRKDGTGPWMDWLVVLPRHVKGPAPVVLLLNYGGNHQLLADPEVVVPTNVWTQAKGHRLDPSTRGVFLDQSRRSVVMPRLLLSRGYALMSACYAQVSPDPDWQAEDPAIRPEPFAYSTGVFDLWPQRDESRDDNITSLGAWAWALSRGLDLAERIPEIDAKRSVATGSSRLAKAALLAASRDVRFAVCVPNQTGGGGCPLAKRDFGENVNTEMTMFPHWFCRAYGRYRENPAKLLTFDQHLLLASIAPRALLVQGFNSNWFDTKGEFLALKAASCAWEAKGLPGLPNVGFPENYDTSAIGPRLGYVRRLGDHGLGPFDWQTLVDFADGVFGLDKVRPIDLQPQIDAAAARGGGTVSVPSGRWVTKGIELRSDVELHLEPGAFLLGSTNLADYAVRELPYSEGEWRAVVSAFGATNVAVTGEGTIDGRGWAFPQPVEYGGEGLRPRGLVFGNCRGVRLTDFTLRDAACWGVVLKESEDVEIRRVRIDTHANANNDGIDIEAKRVVVADCEIDSEDDAVCIKSNDPGYAVEDILVTNVIARSNCNVFKLGTASHGTMRRIRFAGCRGGAATRDFTDVREDGGWRPWFTHADRAATYAMGRMTVYRVDLAPFATCGLAVQCVDGGRVEDVVFENGTLAGVAVPFAIRGGTRTERRWKIPRGTENVLRNIRIENVTAAAAGSIASSVTGVRGGCRPEDVVFRNVKVTCRGDERATVAPVEEHAGKYPDAAMFGSRLPAYGLYIRNAGDVRLENAVFGLAEGRTDPRPAVCREP